METARVMLAKYSFMNWDKRIDTKARFDDVFKQKEELVILIALWLVTLWAELKSNPPKTKE